MKLRRVALPRLNRSPLLLRALIWCGLAAAFTAMIVQYSMRRGRLVLYSMFDDVGYFYDAAWRLQRLYLFGVPDFFRAYRLNPPHSPFSTALAMLSYLVFGLREWAPYAGNALLMIGFLVFADHIFRGLRLWQKICAYLLLLSIPMLADCVFEFRPDAASSLLTVAACFLILERPLVGARRCRMLLIGLLFGLALVAKPPTFPATVALVIGSLGLAALIDLLQRRAGGRWNIRRLWPAGAIIAIAAVVCLPHFMFAWRIVLNYIHETLMGDARDRWITKLSIIEQYKYYLTGASGMEMLGEHLWLMLATIFVAGAYILIYSRRSHILRLVAFGLFVLTTFVMVAVVNQIKSIFFGITFQIALIFAAFYGLRALLLIERRYRFPFRGGSALLIILTVLGIKFFHWPPPHGAYTDDFMVNRRAIADGLYDTIAARNLVLSPQIFIMGVGDINPPVFNLRAVQRMDQRPDPDARIRPVQGFYFYTVPKDDSDIGRRAMEWDRADFIIISQSATQLTESSMKEYSILDESIERIRQRGDYEQIGYFTFDRSGRGFYLFQKSTRFFGWKPVSGLGAAEGPYPRAKLPAVRWGLWPASVLHVENSGGKQLVLNFSARNHCPGQVMAIRVDGREVDSIPLEASEAFLLHSVPLDVAPGPHDVQISYSKSEPGDDVHRAVLFDRLTINPRPE